MSTIATAAARTLLLLTTLSAAPAVWAQRTSLGVSPSPSSAPGLGPSPAAARQPAAAQRGNAVTLQLRRAPLGDALREIVRQSGVQLAYSPYVVPLDRLISIAVVEVPAESALVLVLRGTDVAPRTTPAGTVVLERRRSGTPAGAPRLEGSVAGVVLDANTGQLLDAVTLTVDGTPLQSMTDERGRYRIVGVPVGPQVVRARRVGYTPAAQRVDVGTEGESTADFSLAATVNALEQVIVTGTLVEARQRELPTPISVVTGAQIQEQGFHRVDQIFRGMVPGGFSWEQGTDDYYSVVNIRGASTLIGLPTVKTYIDGIEVADPQYIANIDPSAIERIEVTRGPQASTVYGSGAINGVVQIFTRKGRLGAQSPATTARIALGGIERPGGGGVALRQDHNLSIHGGGQSFSYDVSGSYQRTGDWQPGYVSSNPSVTAGARLLQGPLTAEVTARYSTRYFDPAWNVVLRATGYTPWSRPPRQRYAIRQQTIGLRLGYARTPRLQHQLTLGVDGHDLEYYDTNPRLTTPADSFLQIYSSDQSRASVAYNATLQVPAGSAVSLHLTGGADAFTFSGSTFYTTGATRNQGSLNGTYNTTSRTPYSNRGAFAQARLGVRDALFLTGSVRAERNDNFGRDFGTAVSPRFGVAYALHAGRAAIKARASYGEAIRPPLPAMSQRVVESYYQQLANPLLGPERQKGADGGVDLYLGDRYSLGATYYDQVAIDLIDGVLVDPSATPIAYQSQNVGRVRNRGWELQASAQPFRTLRLDATYSRPLSTVERLSTTYTGTLRVGDRLLSVPRSTAGLNATLSPWARTTVGVDATYAGSWTELDLLALYGYLYGGQPFRGSLRDYWMEYPGFTKVGVSWTQRVTPRLAGFLRVDNVGDVRRAERVNFLVPMGRVTTVGVRVSGGGVP